MAELSEHKSRFLLSHHKRFAERIWLLDVCSALGRKPIYQAITLRNMHWNFSSTEKFSPGDVVVIGESGHEVVAYVVNKETYDNKPLIVCDYICDFAEAKSTPIFNVIDTFTLPAGFMHNSEKLTTTVGRFLFNYIVWYHSGIEIEYINKQQTAKMLNETLAKLLLSKKISPADGRKVINSIFYMASFSALFVPTLTEKSMMTSPEVIKRKKELLKEYGDKLTDPIVAKQFELELIAMDKAYLEGDKSKRFLDPLPAKTYDIHRKKLFISIGGIPAFDKGSSSYAFIPNSLSEGWTAEAFPDICNEIRKGAFDRGKETAKGGEQTKFLLRVLQDVRIIEQDCGTTSGLLIELTNVNVRSFFGQFVITNQGPILLNESTMDKFVGKIVKLRSPMFCKTVGGRCSICAGDMFRELNNKAIGMTVLKVGSGFTTLSMKNMHGTTIKTFMADPFQFIVK